MIIQEKLIQQLVFEGLISLKECVLIIIKLMINKMLFYL